MDEREKILLRGRVLKEPQMGRGFTICRVFLVFARLIPLRIQDSIERIQGHAVREVTEEGELANASSPAVSCSHTAAMLA